jgi:hypothetical protein
MGMPTEPIRDIMRRTIANLEFVERHATPNGPYEVTQLLNSFSARLPTLGTRCGKTSWRCR